MSVYFWFLPYFLSLAATHHTWSNTLKLCHICANCLSAGTVFILTCLQLWRERYWWRHSLCFASSQGLLLAYGKGICQSSGFQYHIAQAPADQAVSSSLYFPAARWFLWMVGIGQRCKLCTMVHHVLKNDDVVFQQILGWSGLWLPIAYGFLNLLGFFKLSGRSRNLFLCTYAVIPGIKKTSLSVESAFSGSFALVWCLGRVKCSEITKRKL